MPIKHYQPSKQRRRRVDRGILWFVIVFQTNQSDTGSAVSESAGTTREHAGMRADCGMIIYSSRMLCKVDSLLANKLGNKLIISSKDGNGNLVEIIEVENHPWFLAGQFHPEFKSSPMEPHPLFTAFISHSRLCRNGGHTE